MRCSHITEIVLILALSFVLGGCNRSAPPAKEASATARLQPPDLADRPNILLILTDNQSAEALGVYGNLDVKTPNIDRLAAEGIRFDHAFAVNGMCSPTRATLMTGLIPSQHGVHDAQVDFRLVRWPAGWNAVREFRTLPLTLRNRGYRTAMIGKWHLGRFREAQLGFEYWLTFTYGHTRDFWDNTVVENGDSYEVSGTHIVDFFAEKTVEYLMDHDGKRPFYLQLNFDGPYALPPTNFGPARNRFYEDYEGMEFKSRPSDRVSERLLARIEGLPAPSKGLRRRVQDTIQERFQNSRLFNYLLGKLAPEAVVEWALNQYSSNQYRHFVQMQDDPTSYANFLSQNTMVDDAVGRVLAALRDKGLERDTLVVYSSDQGNMFGQHGTWGHTTVFEPAHLYETAMRIPLIIRHRGVIRGGQVSNLMVGQYDFMPTILDYVGFGDVPIEGSPGRSFRRHLKGQRIDNWGDEVFLEQEETRGVRTPRYSYWKRYPALGQNELFDLKKDPGQTGNVVDDPDYGSVVASLDAKVEAFFARYADPEYDLWNGGTTKATSQHPAKWRRVYGPDWSPSREVKPIFVESVESSER